MFSDTWWNLTNIRFLAFSFVSSHCIIIRAPTPFCHLTFTSCVSIVSQASPAHCSSEQQFIFFPPERWPGAVIPPNYQISSILVTLQGTHLPSLVYP